MTYNFNIYYNDYISKANLSFNIDDNYYSFDITVHSPECDDCMSNLNSYYFFYEKVNEYGAKNGYTEYINCFETYSSKINNNSFKLFDTYIKITQDNETIIKNLFIKLNKTIIKKVKHYFHIDDCNESDKDDEEIIELNCSTLSNLFNKYNYDISLIKYKPLFDLNNHHLNHYSIEFRGDGFGIIIIDYNKFDEEDDMNNFIGSFEAYPIEKLLQLKVNILSWNKYRWNEENFNEKDIVKDLYNILLKNN